MAVGVFLPLQAPTGATMIPGSGWERSSSRASNNTMYASGVGAGDGGGVGGGAGDLFFSPTAGRDGAHVGGSPTGGGGRTHGRGGHEHDSERDDFIPMSPADLASSRTDKSLPGRFPVCARRRSA